ncbi:hypothetical protein [Candidatus Nitrosocosmicus sp. T]
MDNSHKLTLNRPSKIFGIIIVLVSLITCTVVGNNAFAQTTWETFKEKDGLYSLQIPSNWIPQKVPEADKLTPINDQFNYYGKNSESAPAWLNIRLSESLYYNPTDSFESIIAASSSFEDYKVLQPVECQTYTINKEQACSLIETF